MIIVNVFIWLIWSDLPVLNSSFICIRHLDHLLIAIIRLLWSVMVLPKVIRLGGVYCIDAYMIFLRMRESYKRFVKTWISFVNPWICILSWSWILTPKSFDLCLIKWILDLYHIVDHESWHKKIRFELWITSPANFQRFNLFSWIQWILSTIAQNESLKIQICESESLGILKVWTRKSGFASPNLKDWYRGFDS